MKKDFVLTQESFEKLLDWLDSDREEAGEKYEDIRHGLTRFFRFRGCSDPDSLADETINRVAAKVGDFNSAMDYKKITYFYGFASKIYLEYIARRRSKEIQLDTDSPLHDKQIARPFEENNKYQLCLEDCLKKLAPQEEQIILSYYSGEKSAKSKLRKRLAEDLNLNPGALHIKVHRLRNVLKACVEECVRKK